MDADDLRRLRALLESRVTLVPGFRRVEFEVPARSELDAAGVHPEAAEQMLTADWLPEMVADVIETPSFCGADEPPEQILRYARDVISETLAKRFVLSGKAES